MERRLAVPVRAPHGNAGGFPAREAPLVRAFLRDALHALDALQIVRVLDDDLRRPLRADDVAPPPVDALFKRAELHRAQEARHAAVHRHLLLHGRASAARERRRRRRRHRGGVRLSLIRRVLAHPAHPRASGAGGILRLRGAGQAVAPRMHGERAARASQRLPRERDVRGARAHGAVARPASAAERRRGVDGVHRHVRRASPGGGVTSPGAGRWGARAGRGRGIRNAAAAVVLVLRRRARVPRADAAPGRRRRRGVVPALRLRHRRERLPLALFQLRSLRVRGGDLQRRGRDVGREAVERAHRGRDDVASRVSPLRADAARRRRRRRGDSFRVPRRVVERRSRRRRPLRDADAAQGDVRGAPERARVGGGVGGGGARADVGASDRGGGTAGRGDRRRR
mmetsp:Transcript_5346/g.19281  ORF Transcript_5346/g.19281 Transcript_5346/m.19281 type:complete len:398 (-) Transcript_5346:146-1339(-)